MRVHALFLGVLLAGAPTPGTATAQIRTCTIDAWAYDRGNVRVFADEYSDAGPMIAYGGESPVYVEYDLILPAAGEFTLSLRYAAATPRPVGLSIDGRKLGPACRFDTGSWNTSGAAWEETLHLNLSAGPHTLRLERAADFPHVVSLRLDSTADGEPNAPLLERPKPSYSYRLSSTAADALATARPANPEALRLAITDLIDTFGHRYPNGSAWLKQLDSLSAQLSQPDAAQAQPQLRELERQALLANPLLDFDRVILLKREFPNRPHARRALGQTLGVGSLNAHTSDDTPRQGHWNDTLTVLSNLRGAPRFDDLYNPGDGRTLIDPVLHFDADRLLFAMQGETEKNWRLFELELPGSGLRQVTPNDGEDVAHFDPCYLPDGRIIFASTAVYQGLPCEFGAQAMTCLYLLDPPSQTVRQLTFEQDSDWCPTLLPNGRVLYLRWEYTDQSHANSRILFHMNPDGTDQREFRGSGSWFPPSFFYAKPVPGHPHQVIGVAGGHHGIPRSGRLLLIDPTLGRRDGEGIVQEIPGRGKRVEPIVRDRLIDGVWPQFLMPWPLSSKHHLVAAKLHPTGLWGLYLADVFDNLTLIHEIEGAALLWPIACQPTPTPPIVPDRVNLASAEATVFITDLYSGPGLAGVPRGTVKELRLIEYYFSRRGLGGLYGTLGIDGPWDIKRILGTVPVEPDGSAHFRIPANTALSLQPLDEHGQALQLMRSWFVGMPGEAISCGGCHEPQHEVSPIRMTLAARREPTPIQPWLGPPRGFSFVREVQPVLDKYCVACHDGKAPDRPYLRGDLWLADWSSQLAGRWDGGGKFTESYYQLQRFVRRPGIEGDRRMFTPLDYHFSTTELSQKLRLGHHGVQLDPNAWERLAAWFDLNAPFYGTWGEIPQFAGGYGPHSKEHLDRVHARAMELRRRYVPMGPHPDYEFIPETPPFDATPVLPPDAPEAACQVAPDPADRNLAGTLSPDDWPFDASSAQARQKVAAPPGKVTRTLDLGDSVTLELVFIPAGRFVMGSTTGSRHEQPTSVQSLRSFWIGRCEISNRQFQQFRPSHESRTEDRMGYQFGVLAYNQDQPDQPAVRVAWTDARDFCAWLSTRTGLAISLPTEAQWEWACRAGTATPFWFGNADADYSPYANLGDRRLIEFAADTSLDNYTAARPMVNPNRYDAWIPRDDRFDDGGFVTEPIGQYRPNPWGLHDLHGNAWEWTRSIHRDYPYVETDGRNKLSDTSSPRIVRGGSWRDRPHRATSSFRLAYPPWQRVYNVGFRIVCEEIIPSPVASSESPTPSTTPRPSS